MPHFLTAYNAGVAGAFVGAAVLFVENDPSALAYGVRLRWQRGDHSQGSITLWASVFIPKL